LSERRSSPLPLVIDAIPSTTGAAPALATFKHASAISDRRPVGAKITYIYTAGAWTQSRGPAGLAAWTSDTQPHSGRVGLTTWRWGVEKEVLSSESAGRTAHSAPHRTPHSTFHSSSLVIVIVIIVIVIVTVIVVIVVVVVVVVFVVFVVVNLMLIHV
jgi:hypothetical protein